MDFSSRTASSRQLSQSQAEDAGARDDEQQATEIVDEAARAKEEHLSGLRKRVAAYEQCVEAVGVLTASLEELSAKIEAMKTSTQQLNAFTSGWLTVWKRAD